MTVLSLFAPHVASELLELVCKKRLSDCVWPIIDQALLEDVECTVVVQVNGKMRGSLTVPKGSDNAYLTKHAKALVEKWIVGKKEHSIVIIPNKIVNIVVE
jgi:leucyl-tRNA synthetase